MKKNRFVIIPNSEKMLPEAEDRLTKFLRGNGWELWHWFANLWLVIGPDENVTATVLAQRIKDAVEMPQFMVFEMPSDARGIGINLHRDSTEWLVTKWSNQPRPARV